MNIKFLSIFVLAILVVGLSTVSAVAATDGGVSQSVQIPKDKLIPFAICEGIKIVKVVERSRTTVTSSKKKIRPRGDHSLPTIRVTRFDSIRLPKTIIVTPVAS